MEVVTPSERSAYIWSEEKDYDMVIVGWDADSPDAGSYMWNVATIDNIGAGGCNFCNYANEEVTDLLNQNISITDEKERTELLLEALKIINEDCVFISLSYPSRISVTSDNLAGYDSSAFSHWEAFMQYLYFVE